MNMQVRRSGHNHALLFLFMLVVMIALLLIVRPQAAAQNAKGVAYERVIKERLPILTTTAGRQTVTRTASLLPGSAREYIFSVYPGRRFSVDAQGTAGKGMRLRVTAPSESRPLSRAAVTPTPYHFVGISGNPQDITVRVSRDSVDPAKVHQGSVRPEAFTVHVGVN